MHQTWAHLTNFQVRKGQSCSFVHIQGGSETPQDGVMWRRARQCRGEWVLLPLRSAACSKENKPVGTKMYNQGCNY